MLVDTGFTQLHPLMADMGPRPRPVSEQALEIGAAVWFGELDEPTTEGQLLVVGMNPEAVWLAHVDEPWRPSRQ